MCVNEENRDSGDSSRPFPEHEAFRPAVSCLLTCAHVALQTSSLTARLYVPQVTCDISDTNTTCDITAAVILPQDDSYEMSLAKIMPVMETARLFVMSNNWLPANVNLTFVPMDDRCSNVYSIFRALHAYSTCAHAFFGPSCEYALGECHFWC